MSEEQLTEVRYLRLPKSMDDRIERYRATLMPVPGFARATRLLLDKALAAAGFPAPD